MFDISQILSSGFVYGDAIDLTPYPESEFVTADILKKIMPQLPDDKKDEIAAAINKAAPLYQLNRAGVFHEFIAQVAEECDQFRDFEENLYYSAERLHEVWPHRFPTLDSAKPYAHNARALANKVYADRMGNGNEASNDGYNYRGGGPMMLTGKEMYQSYAKYKGLSLEDAVRLIRSDLYYAVDSAMWFFVVVKALLDEAEKNEFITITKAINGGTTNLKERVAFLENAKKYMPV